MAAAPAGLLADDPNLDAPARPAPDDRPRAGDRPGRPCGRKGDKRILLVDGEPVGAVNRVPNPGQIRSNLAVGGRAEAVELTARDKELCAIIGPELKQRRPDVRRHRRDRRLSDRNQRDLADRRAGAERFTGINAAAILWDAIEAKRATA